jgi:hypothetical protein
VPPSQRGEAGEPWNVRLWQGCCMITAGCCISRNSAFHGIHGTAWLRSTIAMPEGARVIVRMWREPR